MRLPWQKTRHTARVIEPITKGQSEGGGREHRHMPSCVENPDCPSYERARIAVEGKAPAETLSTTSILSPMIHQITAPIVWRDDPVGKRWGPGRCNETCNEAHAYAVKVSPTVVAFERPCVPEDMGAAEWRARQKR